VKKFFVLLCVLVLVAGFAVADDIGLTVGAEFGIGNINKTDDGDWEPYLTPSIAYDKSFLDDALDFSTGLDYTFDFTPSFGIATQTLGFDISVNYSLSLGSASTLSFYLADRNDVTISPKSDEDNNITGTLTPGIKFSQKTGIGSIYARVRAPIDYMQADKNADMTVGLRSRLGWDSTFGLGLWAQVKSKLAPEVVGYNGVDANISYTADSFYVDATTYIGKELSDGISIEPYFEYYLGSFTFYIDCTFDGVAAEGGGAVTISPCIGVTFSF